MLNGNSFSHNLPDHIELKIFSNCGSGAQSEVKGCYNIYNGVTVKFNAQFRLKYCPKDASLWKGSYQISNSQGDYGDDDDLHVDLKLFCACSCDKYGTEKVCRNDKKVSLLSYIYAINYYLLIRITSVSTLVQLKIPALNACVTFPVIGARDLNILTQMALHFLDAILMISLQAPSAHMKQRLIHREHLLALRTVAPVIIHVLVEYAQKVKRLELGTVDLLLDF